MGNVLFRKNQLQEAVGAYKKALELDPNDTAAKINLEYVRDLLDQQEEEQRQEQDKQEKDKEEGEEEELEEEDEEKKILNSLINKEFSMSVKKIKNKNHLKIIK